MRAKSFLRAAASACALALVVAPAGPVRAAGACDGVKAALAAPHGHADWVAACVKATPSVPDARRLCEMRFARCRRAG
ncbi:MAG: hypothetical protein KGQ28_09320 [Hyphomicrobiales bacterium]|nr:hypothetical protein [Hyphomicrobiales bacterium]